ncbi:jun-like transcription factor [Friedmanniomyces endolithicus]|nr:jun-like transcription factor [Friedmanniomyces endolithicus]
MCECVDVGQSQVISRMLRLKNFSTEKSRCDICYPATDRIIETVNMARTKKPESGLPNRLWKYTTAPPQLRDILSQLGHFFQEIGYTETLDTLVTEAKKSRVELGVEDWKREVETDTSAGLLALWESWQKEKGEFPTLQGDAVPRKLSKKTVVPAPDKQEISPGESSSEDSSSESAEGETEGKQAALVDDEAESTSDDSSEDESNSDSSDKEDAKVGAKRKRAATPESSEDQSSSSEEESSGSSDDEEAPPAKRAKIAKKAKSSSDSSSDSSSESEAEALGGVNVKAAASVASSSASDTSPSDDSSSDSSSSDDSTSSDSESSASPPPTEKAKKTKKVQSQPAKDDTDSASSATLAPSSPTKTKLTEDVLLVPASALNSAETSAGDMHPDRLKLMPSSQPTPPSTSLKRVPATEQNVKRLKKENVAFSRIPKDTVVDERFKSNEYVSYEYADKAFQDLSVTKGKGFTKEKNKKKRGESFVVSKTVDPTFAPFLALAAAVWAGKHSRPQQVKTKKSKRAKKAEKSKKAKQADAQPRLPEKPRRRERGRLKPSALVLPDYFYDVDTSYDDEGSYDGESAGELFASEYKPLGLREDLYDFIGGCGFDPMGGFSL